jgi:hypothetical protein
MEKYWWGLYGGPYDFQEGYEESSPRALARAKANAAGGEFLVIVFGHYAADGVFEKEDTVFRGRLDA